MKKKITAAELMAELNADPEFRAKQAQAEAERRERERAHRIAEAPLVSALRTAGFAVQTVWDLVNTPGESYSAALPILLAHLARTYPPDVREGIARALAVPETRALGWDVITSLFRDEAEPRVRDGLACAIAAAADEDVIADVVELAEDSRHGSSRVLLLSALVRSANPQARAALIELRTDPDLSKEIEVILRHLRRAMH